MGADLLQSVQPLYHWLVQIMLPWGLVALFVLTFLESLYLVGLFTPGEVTVVAAALVAAGGKTVPIWSVLLVAWLGGLCGIAFGYTMGRWFGIVRVRKLMAWCAATRVGRFFKLDPGFVDDITEYFNHHGVMTVFGARFAYGAKSFIPPIAGATRMNFGPFIAASALGGILYTTALVIVGWFLQQNVALAGRIMKSIGWFASAVFVALFVFAFVMLKRFATRRKNLYMEKHGIPYEDPRFLARTFWKKISFFDEVSSTNDIALEAFLDGQKEPAAYIAYRQSAGRGRMTRVWSSDEGGVYLSLLLSNEVDSQKVSSLSLVAALAVARAYREAFFEAERPELIDDISIKWPNDVYLGDKKIAGILIEQKNGALVVGVGLNNRRPQNSAQDEVKTATYLDDFGVELHRKQLALMFLTAFENVYATWQAEGFAPLLEEYSAKERNMHKLVIISNHLGKEVARGYCVGFSLQGALLLGDEPQSDPRTAREIFAGEISLRPPTS